MYYSDPDDDLVELQVDNFGDWSKSSEWMRTSPEFAANPIGVFFVPGLFTTPTDPIARLPNFTWRSCRGSSAPIRWGQGAGVGLRQFQNLLTFSCAEQKFGCPATVPMSGGAG